MGYTRQGTRSRTAGNELTRALAATMSSWSARGLLVVAALASAVLVGSVGRGSTIAADAAVPTGFVRELVTTTSGTPISIRFLPNGNALVSNKSGEIYEVNTSTIPATPTLWLDLSNVQSGAERGLIDFALDPNFATNGDFYLYYSPGSPEGFRVSKFNDAGNPAARLATEQVLWTDPVGYITCCHYGAGLDVGPDGKLWFTPGDKFTGSRAQDLTHADGKVIRINTDGSIPDGTDGWPANPYIGPDGRLDEIWAYGLRNPFRARWDIPTGRFFIGEVGGNNNRSWEDLHVSGLDDAGTNYGWPDCEGLAPHTDFPDCGNTPHEDPIWAYPHAGVTGGASITGGEVYRAGIYPAEYDAAYFYGDYAREYIHYLTFDVNGVPTDNVFDDDAGLVVGLAVGLDGSLYSATLTGEVYRYRYVSGGNVPPSVANLTATPPAGTVGQQFTFDASLIDPDSASLTYTWDFGDGTTVNGSGGPGAVSETHTYGAIGSYDVTLTVDDGTTIVTSDILTVQIGTPPTATIDAPIDGALFVAGETINFSAPPPGAGESYEWEVVFTHNDHTHPVLEGVTGTSGSFQVSDSGHDYTGTTGYRVTLTVTDGNGLQGTAEVNIAPDKTDVTVDATPTGITIDIDGVPRVTALTLDTLKGFNHDLIALPSRCINGTVHDFVSWSHGEPATHTFTVPAAAQTIVATYTDTTVSCAGQPPVTSGLALRLTGNDGVVASGGAVTAWQDQTANGNDVVPTGGSPTLVPGALNGNDVISFDGVDDALGRTGFTGLPVGGADRSVVMVVRYDSDGWGGFTYGAHSCNAAFGLGVANTGNLGVQGWCSDYKSNEPGNGAGWMSQAVVLDAGNGSLYKDGALVGTFSRTYNTGTTEMRIGVEIDDSPFVDMEVAEILVYDRVLTATELSDLEAWIQSAYFSGPPPAGPNVDLTAPVDGATVTVDEITADWAVVAGATAGDQVAVSLDGGTPVIGGTTGSHTFTGVADGSHTVTVTVQDSGGTPYPNPEATESATVTVDTSGPPGGSGVPVTDGLVLDLGDGENLSTAGSSVTGWLDRSGLGNDLTLGGGDPQLGVVTPTGVMAVSFDGTDDVLERTTSLTNFPSGSQDRTMFVVAQYNAGKWGGVAFGNNQKKQGFGLGVRNNGALYVNGYGYSAYSATAARGNGWFVHSAVVESNSVTQYDVTNVIATSNKTYQTNLQRLVLGNDLGTNFVNMDLAAVLVYNRALSPAEHTAVANYLNDTYLTGTPGPDTTPPVISLVGGSPVEVTQGSVWSDPGYSASDDVDGDVSGSVVVGGDVVDTATLGSYVLTYDVSDAAGNPAVQQTRTVNVVSGGPGPDTTPPVISLVGGSPVEVTQGSVWSDPGYSASDDVDGDVSGSVVVGGDVVDTATLGSYVLTYDVSDAAGNPAVQQTRTVNVVAAGGGVGPVPVTTGLVLDLAGGENLTTSGSSVTAWGDRSGLGNDVAVGAGSPQQTVTTPAGVAAVSFDGNDDVLERSGTLNGFPSGAQDRTMFVVARYNAGKWGGVVFGNTSKRQAFGLGINKSGNLYVNGWAYNANTSTAGRGNGWFVHSAVVESNFVTQYDGTTVIGTSNRTFETNLQRLALGSDLGSNEVDVDIAAVVIFDRALTPAEHAQVAAYLQSTYLAP